MNARFEQFAYRKRFDMLQNVKIFTILFARNAGIAQLVERHLAKVNVAGSNPVSRSIWTDDEINRIPTCGRGFFIMVDRGAVPKW